MVFPTPEPLKEAVAGSHVAVWGEPQFSRFGMTLFTLFFGFVGLHHVMLRSPLTAILFIVGNFITSGYWFAFDVLQLIMTSEDDLNTYGLGSPFLFEFGVAVGMWKGGTIRGRNVNKVNNPVTKHLFEKHGKGRSNYESVTSAGVSPAPEAAPEGAPNASPSPAPTPTSSPNAPSPNAPAPNTPAPNTPAPGANTPEAAPEATPEAASKPSKGGYRQRGGASPVIKDSGSLKDTAGLLAENVIKVWLEWILSQREKQKAKEYNWEEGPASAWLTFFFILASPFEAVSSALAGDMWACAFHCISVFPFGFFLFPVIFLRAIFAAVYMVFFPMEVFVNGVTRPFPFTSIYKSLDIDGQSRNIQRSKVTPSDPEVATKAFEPFINMYRQSIGLAEGMLAYVPLAAGGRVGGALDKFAEAAKTTAAAQVAAAQAQTQPKPETKVQKGGGSLQRESLEPTKDALSLGVIGAVLLGGLFLGIGRNVFQGKDDSPPVAGRV